MVHKESKFDVLLAHLYKLKMGWDGSAEEIYQAAGAVSLSQCGDERAEGISAVNVEVKEQQRQFRSTLCQFAEVGLNEIECTTSS